MLARLPSRPRSSISLGNTPDTLVRDLVAPFRGFRLGGGDATQSPVFFIIESGVWMKWQGGFVLTGDFFSGRFFLGVQEIQRSCRESQ